MPLNTVGCPRCGCWVKKTFDCFCGQVHSDYCINCGRFTDLKPDEYADLSPIDEVCGKGPILHDHSPEEGAERIRQYFEKVKAGVIK